jgi:hypothetical protein
MTTTPTTYNYYPALSQLISVDDLPDFLGFIKENIQSVFNNIYYKNYCASHNTTGSSAFYRLDIVPRTRLSANNIFDSGFTLVLNPDYDDSTVSSFPVTVFWQWEILRYIRNFNLNTFSYTPEAFFDLAIDILGIGKEEILSVATNTFVVSDEPSVSQFEQLVLDINDLYNSNIEIDDSDEDRYEQLITQVEALNKNVFLTIFELYLLTDNPSETLQKLKDFFNPFFNRDFEGYIKQLFIPKISASLNNITLAIEFPRAWLKPLDSDGNVIEDENIKSMIRFNVGSVRFSTESGFEFENENSFSFDKSEIGNTGLTLYFSGMKLDLSQNSNIPEATAAGYPDNFKGVFIAQAEIGLPSKWFNSVDNTTLQIAGYNMLIGTGGISGRIALEAVGGGFESKEIHRKKLKEKFSQIIFRLFFLQNLYCKAA